jgi:hypothetical protein
VTRLAEFWPIGQGVIFGSFFVNYDRRPKFWTFFSSEKKSINLSQNGLGYFWAIFFTNSSSHPDHRGNSSYIPHRFHPLKISQIELEKK